jgi:type I restriction enzyme, S subunit
VKLPAGWCSESLSAIASGGVFRDGDWVETKDQDPNGSVRLTQLADVGVGRFRSRSDRWMREDQATRLNCTFLRAGDILVARMPEPIGRACVVPEGVGRAVTAVDVAVLRLVRQDVDSRYLMWVINSPQVNREIAALQSGTTRKRVSRKNLERVKVPLPPIVEQRRIVALLEEHLADLENAKASLISGRRRLDALRARLLEDLTPLATPWHPLGELAISSGYGTSTKCVANGVGPAVVRIPNLIGGSIDLTDEKRAQDASIDLAKSMLRSGDLLLVRTNGSKDLIGRAGVVQHGVEAAFASYLIRFRLDPTRVLPGWAWLMLERPSARIVLESLAASSAGQYNLSLGKLNPLTIPVPSLEVQSKLLDAWEQQRTALGRLGTDLETAAKRSETLRRAVLASAFSGRLSGHSSDVEVIDERAEVGSE